MKSLVYMWVDKPRLDWLALAAGAIATALAVEPVRAAVSAHADTLVTMFQGVAGISATLGGFTIAGIAFLIGQLQTTLGQLDAHWKTGGSKHVKSLIFKPLGYLSMTFVFSTVVVLFSAMPGPLRIIAIAATVGSSLAAASSLSRNVWLLARLAQY